MNKNNTVNIGANIVRPFFYNSKAGQLTIYEENNAITGIYWGESQNIAPSETLHDYATESFPPQCVSIAFPLGIDTGINPVSALRTLPNAHAAAMKRLRRLSGGTDNSLRNCSSWCAWVSECKTHGFRNRYTNKNLSYLAKWCINELDDYFNKRLTQFTVPIKLKGTDFQMLVWAELQKIPYGETVSYKYIAENINNPKAVRAVGMANSKNPISIIVPCHRVIASNGRLSGYAGGVDAKSFLIAHEVGG